MKSSAPLLSATPAECHLRCAAPHQHVLPAHCPPALLQFVWRMAHEKTLAVHGTFCGFIAAKGLTNGYAYHTPEFSIMASSEMEFRKYVPI
jgi:hypothetical protein